LIKHILKDCQTLPEVITTLIQYGAIDAQFVRDLQIYSIYMGFKRTDSARGATYSTSIKLGISERTVWTVKKRVEEKFAEPEEVLQ